MTAWIDTPVLIVGGGPVGLALALDLGWRGIDCTLIERGDGTVDLPKMNSVSLRTMEFCRRWGVDGEVKRCPFPDDFPLDEAFVTRLGGHELFRLEKPARKFHKPGPHSPESMQVCSQFWFDPILKARAWSYPSVRLRYRHRLDSFRDTGDAVEADVTELEAGHRLRFRARYLIACDGAASSVRDTLGIRLSGPGVLGNSLHAFFRAPGLIERLGARPANFYLCVDHEGLWGSLRIIDPANAMWRLMIDDAKEVDLNTIDFDVLLARALVQPVAVEWLKSSYWTRRALVAERYSSNRVFLAGDAAHQVSPTGGQGMNVGLADAVDLGWKLAAVLQGWGGKRLLASYDAERRPTGARAVRMTTGYYDDARRLPAEPAIDHETREGAAARERLAHHIAESTSREFRTLGLQLGYCYEGSPLCVPDGTGALPDDPQHYLPSARPGARAPHFFLPDGRSVLDLFGRGFVLLRLGPEAPHVQPLVAAAAERGVPLRVEDIASPEALKRYERRLVLVRPDGHVAWRGDEAPADCEAVVDRVRGV